MSAKVPRLAEVKYIGTADWAGLQNDILGIIIKKLSIPDYVRFRAVCTSWNRVCGDASNCPRTDPWLMSPPNSLGGAKFFSVPERKNQLINIPITATIFGSVWCIVGSSHGWLIYFSPSHGTMQLVNPMNGAQIQLPPIGSRPFSRARLLDVNDTSFTVVVIYGYQKGYKVTRKGSNSWSSVQSKHELVDVFKHRRQLYTIDKYGTVEVWAEPPHAWPDKDAPHVPHVNPSYLPHDRRLNCLLETPTGDLIRVKRQFQNNFAVWILDKGTSSWLQIDNIGEFTLFVSHYSSVCFPAKEHPNLKANCVYFIDIHQNISVFNLKHRTNELVEALETAPAKHQPDARSGFWRQPEEHRYLWFIPSLK